VALLCGEESSSCRRPVGSARAAVLEAEGGEARARVNTVTELQAASRGSAREPQRPTGSWGGFSICAVRHSRFALVLLFAPWLFL